MYGLDQNGLHSYWGALLKVHTEELLLSVAKSMATEILSSKKLTLCLSDNIVGHQVQWLNTLRKQKSKADSVLPCG